MTIFFQALFDGTTSLATYTPDVGAAPTSVEIDLVDSVLWLSNVGGVPALTSVDVDGGNAKPIDPDLDGVTLALKLPSSPSDNYYVEIKYNADPGSASLYTAVCLRASTMVTGAWPFAKNTVGGEVDLNSDGSLDVYVNEISDGVASSDLVDSQAPGAGAVDITLRVEIQGDVLTTKVDGATLDTRVISDPNFVSAGDTYVVIHYQSVPATGGYLDAPIAHIEAGTFGVSAPTKFNRLIKDLEAVVTVVSGGSPGKPAYCANDPRGRFYTFEELGLQDLGIETGGIAPHGIELDEQVLTCHDTETGEPVEVQAITDWNAGWSGAARSVGFLAGTGQLQFSVERNVIGVFCGLNDVNQGVAYAEINFAFYFSNGLVKVMERGVDQTLAVAYTEQDTFTISRIGSEVRYWKNAALMYQSTAGLPGSLFVDCSMYLGGDEIFNAVLSDTVDVAFADNDGGDTGLGTDDETTNDDGSTNPNCVIGPFYGFAADGDGAYAANVLRRFTGYADNFVNDGSGAVLTSFTAEAYGDLNGAAYSATALTDFTGYAESGLIHPEFCVASGIMQPVQGWALSINGPGAEAYNDLHGFSGYAVAGSLTEWNTSQGGLYKFAGFAFSSDTLSQGYLVDTLAGGYSLFAFASRGDAPGFDVTLGGGYTLNARSGGAARGTLATPTLSMSATIKILARLTEDLPVPTLSASGTTKVLARLTRTLRGDYSLTARSGGAASVELPVATLSTSATVSVLGRATVDLPVMEISASGYLSVVATGEMTLPAMTTAPSAVLRSYLPRMTLLATGYGVLSSTYEAYAFTLIEQENAQIGVAASRYTDYPFLRIVRFGDKYYGVATDGLFELTGDTFDGDPIVSVIHTFETDFDRREQKRPNALFLAGRVGADMNVAVVHSEDETNTYTNYRPVTKTGARTFRAVFGKGVRANYVSYRMTNLEGEDFAIDTLTPEIDVLSRSLK